MDFRQLLKKELALRCSKNTSYSLRSFAKNLGLSHATLSQVMSGKRPLSKKAQNKIIASLKLGTDQLTKLKRNSKMTFEEKFEPVDIQKIIAIEWYYDAILELLNLKSFKPDAQWVANALDLPVAKVNEAIEKMKNNNLLKVTSTGNWKDPSKNNSSNYVEDFTDESLKRYQKDLLSKSLHALENLPRNKRDHTSLVLSFSEKNVKHAKEAIKKFRTEFSSDAQETASKHDEVYALSVSFFPISKTEI